MVKTGLFQTIFPNPKENDFTQCLVYFLQTNRHFQEKLLSRVLPKGVKLKNPSIVTQHITENGRPDISIQDAKKHIQILIEVKIESPETINFAGVGQLTRYSNHLSKRQGWESYLVLLSKYYFEDVPEGCIELRWSSVYADLEECGTKHGMESDFIDFMGANGMGEKTAEFDGFEGLASKIAATGKLGEMMEDFSIILATRLGKQYKVKRNCEYTSQGWALNLMKVSLGKKKFQVMIFPGSQYSIDLKAGRKPGKLYLFLWTSRAGLGVRTINKLEKAGFGTTSYPQKHFLIREMGSKTKQINEIVSYIDQSMRLLK